MRRSLILATVAALTVSSAAPALAVGSSATRDTPVTDLRAYTSSSGVAVTWTNPEARGFTGAVVRYQQGPRVPGRHAGREVSVGRRTDSVTLTGLKGHTTYTVNVRAGYGHVSSTGRHIRFTTGGGPEQARGRLTARYVDPTGAPLAGVQVLVYSPDLFDSTTYSATSGSDGRVSVTVPKGAYYVLSQGADATGGSSDATGYLEDGRSVSVPAHRVLSIGSVVLRPAGAVRVHVVDGAGRPIAGVDPTLAPVVPYVSDGEDEAQLDAYDSLGAGRTDANGDATLRGVYPSEAFRVCVNDSDFGPLDALRDDRFLAGCSTTSTLARTEHFVTAPTVVLRRQAGGLIAGVVGATGHSGFSDSYIEVRRGRRAVAYATTDGRGRFRVGGLTPGGYRVCAVDGMFTQAGRTGFLPGCASKLVTVPTSLTAQHAAISLRPAAAATGTISGLNGAPAPGAGFGFQHGGNSDFSPFFVGQDGRFLVKGLPAGPNDVCVFTDNETRTHALPTGIVGNCGQNSARFTGVIGKVSTGLDLRLPAGAALAGTVVDTAGHPISNAVLDVTPLARKGPSSLDDRQYQYAQRDGHYDIVGLHSGRFQVCAGIGDDPEDSGVVSRCRKQAVTVTRGHTTFGAKIVLPQTAAISVTAVDQQGQPVAGVDAAAIRRCTQADFCDAGTALLRTRDTTAADSETTGSNGRARLTTLTPGTYAVCLFAYFGTTRTGAPKSGYADTCTGDTFTVVVRAGRTTAVRLVLNAGGVVTGRVTDSSGRPVSGVVVHVVGSAADDLPADDAAYGNGFAGEDGGATANPLFYSTTASDGSFSVRSVRPGSRLVCFVPSKTAEGAAKYGYLAQCSGGEPGDTKAGTPVKVTSGGTTTVDIELTARAALSGTITTNIKNPEGTAVVVFDGSRYVTQKPAAKDGSYLFSHLIAGNYEVCADVFDSKGREHGLCYRDSAWDPETGKAPTSNPTPVTVTAGMLTPGISFHVRA